MRPLFVIVAAVAAGSIVAANGGSTDAVGGSKGVGGSKDPPYVSADLPGWPAVVEGYRAALQRAGIAGSSLMVVRDGRIVARQNEGFQNSDRREPVTDETIYHWASITKTFTGIAIMQLRDLGLLSLDDPVVKYVPELRLAHDPFGDISQVKIRILMSKIAGFCVATLNCGCGQPGA